MIDLKSACASHSTPQRRAASRGQAVASTCILILDILALGMCCAAAISVRGVFAELCVLDRYLMYERVCIYVAIAVFLAALLIVKELRMGRDPRAVKANLAGLAAALVLLVAIMMPLVVEIQWGLQQAP